MLTGALPCVPGPDLMIERDFHYYQDREIVPVNVPKSPAV